MTYILTVNDQAAYRDGIQYVSVNVEGAIWWFATVQSALQFIHDYNNRLRS